MTNLPAAMAHRCEASCEPLVGRELRIERLYRWHGWTDWGRCDRLGFDFRGSWYARCTAYPPFDCESLAHSLRSGRLRPGDHFRLFASDLTALRSNIAAILRRELGDESEARIPPWIADQAS